MLSELAYRFGLCLVGGVSFQSAKSNLADSCISVKEGYFSIYEGIMEHRTHPCAGRAGRVIYNLAARRGGPPEGGRGP